MKFVYFDCSSGASGDMILASLLSLGVPLEDFRKAINSLKLRVEIKARKASSHGFTGMRVDVIVPDNSAGRNFSEVESLIKKSMLGAEVKESALKIFKRLFMAESRVHGRSFRTTHLHEAAADDALVDIVGTCWLLRRLRVEEVYFSPVNLGSGYVETSHGLLPVPPPAVAELMAGFPVYSSQEQTELLTPTGAAILTGLGRCLNPWPELVYEKIGYGLGRRQLRYHPNLLRAFYGKLQDFQPARKIQVIEATIDDASPQLLGNFLNRALELGALEAYLTPVVMKKNRLGNKLTIMAEIDKIDRLIEAIFRETTTIGLRYYPVERRVLRREIKEVRLKDEKIRVKVSYYGGEAVNFQPEFDDCLRVAEKLKLPLKQVITEAIKKFRP
ncbi:MAG: nickel pincer cofactor biosynthesis protein LarC [Candidatus Saccharicenans sp.]|uniref:nickel pincer cofactor biosynthesis protein LarC n=1 Tax=Candidatus Saccharicenans sp. TaxID=2819258 RepID=UPI0040494082